MRKNITAIISSIALIILVIIQVYVIRSYYNAKSEIFDMTYSAAVRNSAEFDFINLKFDSLESALNKMALDWLTDYSQTANNIENQKSIVNDIDSLIKKFDYNSARIKKYLYQNNLDTNIHSTIVLKEISFIDINNQKQDIYKRPKQEIQNQKNIGLYIKSFSKEDNYYAVKYDYFIDFTNKHKLIFLEIRGLLILVIITISAVLFAFTYTLLSLQRHKKLTELKDDFIDNITHEFKTPLSIISVAVSSLKNEQIQKDRSRFLETCNILENQNKFLAKMIDNVIEVSLFERNKVTGNMQNVFIKQFFQDLVKTFKKNELTKGKVLIKEDYNIPEDFIYCLNPEQFQGVIFNLLNNSVKYCDRDPEIIIRIRKDKEIKIEIIDNGIGIPEEKQAFIFNKFYRIKEKRSVKGIGLGLYLVKKIVNNHNGTILIKQSTNQGTTMLITLPVNSNRNENITG